MLHFFKHIGYVLTILLALTLTHDAEAARRKKKFIDEDKVFGTEILIGTKKKQRYVTIDCFGKKPGKARRTKRGVLFNPFAKQVRTLKARSNAPKKKIKRLQQMIRAGKKECRLLAADGGGVDVIDLTQHRGAFGVREAAILGDRFCFGFTAAEQERASSIGLPAMVNEMISWKSVASEEAAVRDITCDTYLKGENRGEDHPNEKECNVRNPKDYSVSGLRQTFFIRALGANCYHAKMVSFLADERGAPTLRYAEQNYNRRHLGRSYVDELWDTARTGDYREYVRRFTNGYGAVVLNLVESIKQNPNEDFAREFWELVTVGHRDLNGNLNYGVLDIASGALAFTGLAWTSIDIDVGGDSQTRLEYPAFVADLHAPGSKRIFIQSPHERSVDGWQDMITAAFAHPSTAIDLARDICQEFFSPKCAKSSISKIASWIKQDNFNLNATMRRVMLAAEHYKPRSKNNLIKHPIEYVVGFHRKIGLKRNHRSLDSETDALGQRMFMPATIFGHYERELAGEARVLDRRRMCMNIANISLTDLEEYYGYDLNAQFLQGLNPSLDASVQLLERLEKLFHLTLSADQREALNRYLNFNYDNCDNWEYSQGICPVVGQYYLKRDAFDPYQCESCEKIQGLLAILCMLPQMQTK